MSRWLQLAHDALCRVGVGADQPMADFVGYREAQQRSGVNSFPLRLRLDMCIKDARINTFRGKLSRVATKTLAREQVKSFLNLVGSVKFWDIRSPTDDLGCVDGSQWIMEGESYGTYKIVDIFSAPATSSVMPGLAVLLRAHDDIRGALKEDIISPL
jgi:hypothetical protein